MNEITHIYRCTFCPKLTDICLLPYLYFSFRTIENVSNKDVMPIKGVRHWVVSKNWAMGGFNDKEQANVGKFFWGKSGYASRQSMVENSPEKNFRSRIFSKSRNFGGQKSKNPDFPQKNFPTLACSLSLNPPNVIILLYDFRNVLFTVNFLLTG